MNASKDVKKALLIFGYPTCADCASLYPEAALTKNDVKGNFTCAKCGREVRSNLKRTG